jgi:hypothetical protein
MYNGTITANAVTPSVNMKNRIINGNMSVDQRNAGAATANTISGYTLDRWNAVQTTTGKLIVQQNAGSVTPPAGFTNYLGVTSQSAYSIGAGDFYAVLQSIEGYNLADLNWGTANAKTVTLSFWVRSSLTGTFGLCLNNGGTRSYPFTYTISSANTWEQKSITVAGDQSGTWNATNGTGVQIWFGLGVGSTNAGPVGAWASANYVGVSSAVSVVGTNGATFYLTGVQLEVGTQATTFTTAGGSYGAELALCQRYYESTADIGTLITAQNSTYRSNCSVYASNNYFGPVVFKVNKRAVPTVTFYYSTSSGSLSGYTTSGVSTVAVTSQNESQYGCNGTVTGVSNLSFVQGNWIASAEL